LRGKHQLNPHACLHQTGCNASRLYAMRLQKAVAGPPNQDKKARRFKDTSGWVRARRAKPSGSSDELPSRSRGNKITVQGPGSFAGESRIANGVPFVKWGPDGRSINRPDRRRSGAGLTKTSIPARRLRRKSTGCSTIWGLRTWSGQLSRSPRKARPRGDSRLRRRRIYSEPRGLSRRQRHPQSRIGWFSGGANSP
jgi:hypothetical protein